MKVEGITDIQMQAIEEIAASSEKRLNANGCKGIAEEIQIAIMSFLIWNAANELK